MAALVNVIRSSDIARCPKMSMLPRHYRPDGTCRCDEREAARAALTDAAARRDLADVEFREAREWLEST